MKLIILAAGYATRLYPLTMNQPKPLLPVAGKPMLEHVLDRIGEIKYIDQAFVVTNAKFTQHFENWASDYRNPKLKFGFTTVNDGTTDESNRLGAIGDLHLVMNRYEIEDDVIVVGGDNLFSHDLTAFGDYCLEKKSPVTGVYDVGDLEEIKKYNAIEIDDNNRINYFEEKPKVPKSTLTGIALYYYPQQTLALIRQYISEGNNPDQPGRLVQWMYQRAPFYIWKVPGLWFDIGSIESLEEANRVFSEL